MAQMLGFQYPVTTITTLIDSIYLYTVSILNIIYTSIYIYAKYAKYAIGICHEKCV